MDKIALAKDQERAIDELEKILDFTLGKNRGIQIPGHKGNGQHRIENKNSKRVLGNRKRRSTILSRPSQSSS